MPPAAFDEIVTDRLRIRRFAASDAGRLLDYRLDPVARRMQGWDSWTLDDATRFATRASKDTPGTPDEWFQFAVADIGTDLLLGDVGLHTSADGTAGRVGTTMHPDSRRDGLALEAMQAIINFGFDRLGLVTISADALADNLGSLRLLTQLGFARTGRPAAPEPVDGGIVHELDYELTVGLRHRLPPIVGVLVGGRSTRMGRDKSGVEIDGRTMLDHVLGAVDASGLDAVLLGPDDKGTGRRWVPDGAHGGRGPMIGLRALHGAIPDRRIILLATDQPFVSPTTILHLALAPEAPALVPIDGGHPQVTCARYAPGAVEAAIDGSIDRLRDLLDLDGARRVEPETWHTWSEDGASFRSLDRPEDLPPES